MAPVVLTCWTVSSAPALSFTCVSALAAALSTRPWIRTILPCGVAADDWAAAGAIARDAASPMTMIGATTNRRCPIGARHCIAHVGIACSRSKNRGRGALMNGVGPFGLHLAAAPLVGHQRPERLIQAASATQERASE